MKGTLRWFVLAFFLAFLLWYISGGPDQEDSQRNAFIDAPKQNGVIINMGDTYNAQTLKDRLQNK